MKAPFYVPQAARLPGLKIPVHMMRRLFNYMGNGRCVGVEIVHRGVGPNALHGVTLHFDTSPEAAGFYRSLLALYEIGTGRGQ